MGGRSGQSVGGGANVSSADYAEASKKDWYQSYYNGNENEKTLNAYAERGFYVNYNIRDGNLDKADKQYIENLDKALNKLIVINELINIFLRYNEDNHLSKVINLEMSSMINCNKILLFYSLFLNRSF